MREVTVYLEDPPVRLPDFTVAQPWWQEAESVVVGVKERFGLAVILLRLLSGERVHESPAAYLAQLVEGDPTRWTVGSRPHGEDHPLRMPWARPGGPQADLDWAVDHVDLTGPPVQVRTWNLSSIWRLPTVRGTVWLKHVPGFFSHEGAVIELLAASGHPVPSLIARRGGLILLREIPGVDGYQASLDDQLEMVERLVSIQARVDPADVLALGAPDWREQAFLNELNRAVDQAPPGLRKELAGLIEMLPARFSELADCGLPDTLVHGDFHPGNTRLAQGGPVILDWGDCGVGHPLLDLSAFLNGNSHAAEVRSRWLQMWKTAYPGSDPERAARLAEPLAALRQAMIYQKFLDHIEPSERVYHRDDPVLWLSRAVKLVHQPKG